MTTVAGELSSEPSSSHGRLRALWETAPTLLASLLTVDHKKLGIRYIVTATVFAIAAPAITSEAIAIAISMSLRIE